MKFNFHEAAMTLLGFLVLAAIVAVGFGVIGAYLEAAILVGNWLSVHFANYPAFVFVIMVAVFVGIPIFILGGFGFFKADNGD